MSEKNKCPWCGASPVSAYVGSEYECGTLGTQSEKCRIICLERELKTVKDVLRDFIQELSWSSAAYVVDVASLLNKLGGEED